jgi:hypothetical protein
MPIKRGGQTRSNAGRYAPEGQGATQRGGRTQTPSGRSRPTQTARLPRANMPGTVTATGAARTAAGAAGGGMMSRLAMFIPHVAAAAAGLSANNTGDGTLEAARKRGDYKPSQNVPNPQEGMTRAESFDQAFSKARNAGEKSFNWRGRTYTTKMKGK